MTQNNEKKTKKEKKEKKNKLSLRRKVSNLVFALRQIWEASPSYFIVYYLCTFIWAPLDFLTGSYLLRMIVNSVERDSPPETIITYMLVIGAKEVEEGTVAVRSRKAVDMGAMPVDDFINMALEEIRTKAR